MKIKSISRKTTQFVIILSLLLSLSRFSWAYEDSSKSGYTTTSQVVDTKTLYVKHHFVESDFTTWLNLLYQAQAYEKFQSCLASGQLNYNGIVQGNPLRLGSQIFEIGVGVTVDDIESELEPTFNAKSVLSALQSQTVLDAGGYVEASTQNATNGNLYYDSYNFSFITPKIKKITLPLTQSVTKEALLNELYSLILTKHRMVEVATQDTTRYQSKNDNIFTGLLESVGGNFLGSILAPDKIRVNRQEYTYIPQTYIPSLYPMRRGFSPFPYFDKRTGLTLLNGNSDNKDISFSTGTLGDLSMSRTELALKFEPKEVGYASSFPFFQCGAGYNEVVMNSGTRRQGSLSIGGGAASAKSLTKYILGVEYEKYLESAALGLIFRGEMNWFVAPPISLGIQGGLSSSGIWKDFDIEAGINFHFSGLALGVGYRYYNFQYFDQQDEASGVIGTVRYYF